MVTQPFFKAPEAFTEAGEFCTYCGNLIIPGELIVELRDDPIEYAHEGCADQLREDAQAAA
jgi:hypothetical protein